ncbi:MAG TPA: ABC transporter substrate-binding protein, partial [Thermoplasmata archaeon]|nr:ABC transporter substrate-binding protein [Thermoplasmata archaeon]
RLVANDRHWKGRPFLDAVTFRFPYTLVRNANGSTQANDAACAFLKGQVNLIAWPLSQNDLTNERDCAAGFGGWSDGVNRTLLNPDPARTMPFAAVAENPGLQFLYLGMNTQRAPLTDPTLRVALSMAIDRDLVAGTYGGAVEPKVDIADSPVSPANLAWFNASVPKYRVPRAVVGSNAVPSLEEVNAFLDAAGYLDRTGDGFRDTPAGTPFNFTLLTFDQATDPRVAKYLDLITKFRAIGINVVQQEHTPADLRALEASDAFDLVVDIQQAEGEPSFLFDLLHSGSPGNVVNVASPALDALLDTARDALDPVARRQAVLDAQGWVALQVPLAPIVHYRAETTYDRTTFEGWVDGLGGIANFWTFTTAHVTQMGPLTVTVDALPPSIRSGSGTDILVRAWDAEANAVAGVDVELSGVGLAATSGVTDAQGAFTTRFTAPSVDVAQDFTIAADAAKAGYGGAGGATTVTVHPLARTFTVLIGKDSPTLASGNTTAIRVQVLDDQTLLGVPAANVTITISPEGLTASVAQATGVTLGNGIFATTFTADVTVASRFVITANATAPGYETSSGTTAIDVTARPAGGTAPPTAALDTLSMVAVVASLAAVYGAWQRRKWVARKP